MTSGPGPLGGGPTPGAMTGRVRSSGSNRPERFEGRLHDFSGSDARPNNDRSLNDVELCRGEEVGG